MIAAIQSPRHLPYQPGPDSPGRPFSGVAALVQLVEVEVRQQRADDTPLRGDRPVVWPSSAADAEPWVLPRPVPTAIGGSTWAQHRRRSATRHTPSADDAGSCRSRLSDQHRRRHSDHPSVLPSPRRAHRAPSARGGTHTRRAENLPRRSAPRPTWLPSGPPDRGPWEYPADVARRSPWGSSLAAPLAGGSGSSCSVSRNRSTPPGAFLRSRIRTLSTPGAPSLAATWSHAAAFRSVMVRVCSDKRMISCWKLDMTPAWPLRSPGMTPGGPRRLPTHQLMRLCLPARLRVTIPSPSDLPGSQSVSRGAPSALTLAGCSGADADCFPARAGFAFSGRLATCNLCFEAVPGSIGDGLRLTVSLSAASDASLRLFPVLAWTGLAPHAWLPPRDRPPLQV